jgi:hypothetical protein
MAVGGIEVLRFAAHLPLRRHFFRGDPHSVSDRDVLIFREYCGVEARLVAAHRHHAHAFGAAGDHHLRFAQPNAVGRKRDRLHARGAEAVHRHAGDAVGEPREEQPDARDVHALLGFGHRATDDHVVGFARIQAGTPRHHRLEHVREHVVGTHVPEHAARRFADGHSRRGDDVGVLNLFSHLNSSVTRRVR